MRSPPAAALSLLLLALAGGCGGPSSAAPPQQGWPATRVAVVPVVSRDVPVYIDEIGRAVAREVVSIQTQVAGQVKEILFADGADVRKGDPLFAIDPRPYRARLDQAEAALAQSRAQAAERKLEFERAKRLLGTRAVSKQDYEAKESALAVADTQVQAAAAAVESARVDLDYTAIASPIDGRAGRRLVDVGNVVSPGDRTTLLVIERLDPIYAEFTITESDLARVRESMARGPVTVEVRSPDDPTLARDGVLSFIDNAVQDGTGTVSLRATFPNEDRRLWPGQFVRVRVILDVSKGALLLPAGAAQVGQMGPFVWVVKPDSTVEQRSIELGQRHEDLVAVRAQGLAAGDRVVTAGTMMLFPGARVDAHDEASPEKARP